MWTAGKWIFQTTRRTFWTTPYIFFQTEQWWRMYPEQDERCGWNVSKKFHAFMTFYGRKIFPLEKSEKKKSLFHLTATRFQVWISLQMICYGIRRKLHNNIKRNKWYILSRISLQMEGWISAKTRILWKNKCTKEKNPYRPTIIQFQEKVSQKMHTPGSKVTN